MAISENRIWRAADDGGAHAPYVGSFTLTSEPIPKPGNGQILARACYLSVDRCLYDNPNGTGRVGRVIPAGAVAEVIESQDMATRAGTLVQTDDFGWREFAALDASRCLRVDESVAPPEAWLSYLGAPGLTAWLAIDAAGGVTRGDAVLVSDAAGAVGQLAGQLVKSAGGTAVGLVANQEQRVWCEQIGFDAVISTEGGVNVRQQLTASCRRGFDLFIDSCGATLHDHLGGAIKAGGRIVACGVYGAAATLISADPNGQQHWLRTVVDRCLTLQGFSLPEHAPRFAEARDAIIEVAQFDEFDYLFDIVDGFNALPDALMRLRTGKCVGKQLVKVG